MTSTKSQRRRACGDVPAIDCSRIGLSSLVEVFKHSHVEFGVGVQDCQASDPRESQGIGPHSSEDSISDSWFDAIFTNK